MGEVELSAGAAPQAEIAPLVEAAPPDACATIEEVNTIPSGEALPAIEKGPPIGVDGSPGAAAMDETKLGKETAPPMETALEAEATQPTVAVPKVDSAPPSVEDPGDVEGGCRAGVATGEAKEEAPETKSEKSRNAETSEAAESSEATEAEGSMEQRSHRFMTWEELMSGEPFNSAGSARISVPNIKVMDPAGSLAEETPCADSSIGCDFGLAAPAETAEEPERALAVEVVAVSKAQAPTGWAFSTQLPARRRTLPSEGAVPADPGRDRRKTLPAHTLGSAAPAVTEDAAATPKSVTPVAVASHQCESEQEPPGTQDMGDFGLPPAKDSEVVARSQSEVVAVAPAEVPDWWAKDTSKLPARRATIGSLGPATTEMGEAASASSNAQGSRKSVPAGAFANACEPSSASKEPTPPAIEATSATPASASQPHMPVAGNDVPAQASSPAAENVDSIAEAPPATATGESGWDVGLSPPASPMATAEPSTEADPAKAVSSTHGSQPPAQPVQRAAADAKTEASLTEAQAQSGWDFGFTPPASPASAEQAPKAQGPAVATQSASPSGQPTAPEPTETSACSAAVFAPPARSSAEEPSEVVKPVEASLAEPGDEKPSSTPSGPAADKDADPFAEFDINFEEALQDPGPTSTVAGAGPEEKAVEEALQAPAPTGTVAGAGPEKKAVDPFAEFDIDMDFSP